MNQETMFWAVYDLFNNEVVGFWEDICYAEEFKQENEAPEDMWAVMSTEELYCDLATL